MGDNTIGSRIYDLRMANHVQQCELAKAVGLHQSVLNRIEKGTRTIRATELLEIAAYFAVRMEYLLGSAPKAKKTASQSNCQCEQLEKAEADLV